MTLMRIWGGLRTPRDAGMAAKTWTLVRRLRTEDAGQEFVEYALLSGFIGLGALAGFNALQNSLTASYTNWDTGQQNLADPPDPL